MLLTSRWYLAEKFFIFVSLTAVGPWAIARRSALSTIIRDASACGGGGSGTRSVGGKGCYYNDTKRDLSEISGKAFQRVRWIAQRNSLSSKVFSHTSNLPEKNASAYKTGRELRSGWGEQPRWFNRLLVSLTSGFRELIWVSGILNLLIWC